MRVAAIGIGSNSLRMLIADVKDAQLLRVLRDREGLRVFAALDEKGNIEPQMLEKAAASVADLVQKARAAEAEEIHVFATSAVRDAGNQEEFERHIYEATGLHLEICTGEVEAALSFLGATWDEPCGMIDIGGGSTEIVLGHGADIHVANSLQMGAVRLFRQIPVHTVEDAYRVVTHAREILMPYLSQYSTAKEYAWVGVGGTFTTTAALAQDISWTDRAHIHSYPLARGDVSAIMEMLAPLSVEQRLLLKGLQPQRADIVVHGLAILVCCMQTLDIEQIRVSEYGNLEGYLKYRYLGIPARK